MYTVKQTRTYPTEFTVALANGEKAATTFHGENAQQRAESYAAFLNAAPDYTAPEHEQERG